MTEGCSWYDIYYIKDGDSVSNHGYCLLLCKSIDCFGEYLNCGCETERKAEEKALTEDRKE